MVALTLRLGLRPIVAAACLLVTGIGAAGAQSDGFLQSYRLGLDAIDEQRWPDAVTSFQGAIAGRSEAARRLLSRGFTRPYLPHFYLGLALAEARICQDALIAFAESERQGVVTRRQEFEILTEKKQSCIGRVQIINSMESELAEVFETAAATSTAVQALAREEALSSTWRRGSPSLAARERQADADIDAAATAARSPSNSPDRVADLERATELATRAARDLVSIRRDGRSLRDQLLADLASDRDLTVELHGQIDELVSEARKALADIEHLRPFPSALGRARADLDGLVGESTRDPGEDASAYYLGFRDRLRNSLERLDDVAIAPGVLLNQAADAYLGGEFTLAVDLLESASFSDPRSVAHRSLLLAASLYAMHSLGDSDAELLARSREAIATGREADSGIAPPTSFMPPDFIEFFDETVSAAGEEQ